MSGGENAGLRMVAALKAAGFTVAGQRAGQYVRMGWPGSDPGRGSLLVPVDDTAPEPEFAELLALVKAQLLAAARRGEAAPPRPGPARIGGVSVTAPLRSMAEDPWIRAAYIRQVMPLIIRQRRTRTYYRTRWWR